MQEKSKSAIDVLIGESRIEDTIPVYYRNSDSFNNHVTAVDEANTALAELNSIMQNNAEEVEMVSRIIEENQRNSEDSVERLERTLRSLH
jgi:methyl-accepting chemotaxis protein